MADAIYIWSLTDGGHDGEINNHRADYVAPTGEGLWVPTARSSGDPLPALQPYWGDNRPFALTSGGDCAPPPPPAYSLDASASFYVEALEVYDTVRQLTPEQQEIALFWSDDPGQTSTPPGHSISILTQIIRQQELTLDRAAEAYARLGIALADSFIACWKIKFQYSLLRPVTYIQTNIDAAWNTLLSTPPFPEYPSGHSVQSAAAAAVLEQLFGESFSFLDHTHSDRGMAPRHFESFAEFAEEAALSRLYGGIHYRSAIEQGLEQGRCISERVNSLIFRRDEV
ncbi:MAG: vanadium-dependent haloperoxidase [Chloroflexi bacterium]|nr:vanadium-dependent haloperoxidase [Chloroflexota bacterium]